MGVEIDTFDMALCLHSDTLDELLQKQEGYAKGKAIPFGFF